MNIAQLGFFSCVKFSKCNCTIKLLSSGCKLRCQRLAMTTPGRIKVYKNVLILLNSVIEGTLFENLYEFVVWIAKERAILVYV